MINNFISEDEALFIVHEFLTEILNAEKSILTLYVIGSLGGGYYRPGQSDIDTVIIVRDDVGISQKQMDKIAEKYHKKYNVPKGFGSVMIRESELLPPYVKSEIEEFEFTIEIARHKTQGKAIYGSIKIDAIKMPTKEDFIKDALIMEHWFGKEFGYPMFDKLHLTGCLNCILGCLRRYLIIEKNIFEFNKFKTIEIYKLNNPPIINDKAFEFIHKNWLTRLWETKKICLCFVHAVLNLEIILIKHF
jgi:hypothetical protein